MSKDLVKIISPIFGKFQINATTVIEDKRNNLFTYMLIHDENTARNIAFHDPAKWSREQKVPDLLNLIYNINGNQDNDIANVNNYIDLEIDLFICDVAERLGGKKIDDKSSLQTINFNTIQSIITEGLGNQSIMNILVLLLGKINDTRIVDRTTFENNKNVTSVEFKTQDAIKSGLYNKLVEILAFRTIPGGKEVRIFVDFNNNTITPPIRVDLTPVFDVNAGDTLREITEFKNYYHTTLRGNGPMHFSFELDQLMIRNALEYVSKTNIVTDSKFFKELNDTFNEKTFEYYRKPEDLTKLYTLDDGKEIEVQVKSQKYYEATKHNNGSCNGTYVKDQGVLDPATNVVSGETCADYLTKCLAGNDINNCRTFMKNKNFWGVTGVKEEVKKMLPSIALLTLEKFEFRQISQYDTIVKKNLNKIESVTSWLEHIVTRLDPVEFNQIKDNINLNAYLDLLVNKINNSPQILNIDITKSEETQYYNPKQFAGTDLAKMGILPKLPNDMFNNDNNARFSNTINSLGLINRSKFLIPFGIMKAGGIMTGGDGLSEYTLNLDNDYKFASIEWEKQYNSYKNILKDNGKTIDPADDKALSDLIKDLKKSEKKVVISIKLIEKYTELINVFKYNDPKKLLSLSNLDELVNIHKSQLEKGVKRQDNIASIMNTLSTVISSAVTSAVKSTVNTNIVQNNTIPFNRTYV